MIKCQFNSMPCRGKPFVVWIQRHDGSWTTMALCERCFNAVNTTMPLAMLRYPPTEIWIKDLFNKVVGGKDEK